MKRKNYVLFSFAVALASFGQARADLLSYVARPEPEWRWEKKLEMTVGELKVNDLSLCSQVWRGIKWEHTIRIISPPSVRYPDKMLLLVTGGDPGSPEELLVGAALVKQLGTRFAILYNIPNQPLIPWPQVAPSGPPRLYKTPDELPLVRLREDDLIAHTYAEYLNSGDEEWPLLFPMAKSAVKAMDALQAFTEKEFGRKVEGFVVTGASKRGWTTWLTAVADKRVKGIIPIVYDNLNIPAQMPYQLATWGRYSEQIEEYTRRGLQALLGTERGKQLMKMVDPYSYLSRLKMPKLIINATNDRYWTVDALNLYWNDLPGDKWVLYVPNSGHSVQDFVRVVNTAGAFFQHVADGPPMPKMKWTYKESDGKLTLTLECEPQAKTARLWVARSATRDFRDSKWEENAMQAKGSSFVGTVEVPKEGSLAVLGEADFSTGSVSSPGGEAAGRTLAGQTFSLSTTMRVVPEIAKPK
jgi:PhoPQ-activated pathogenicity-related protein